MFLTTAIDYANAKPHLGHAYEKVLTDTLARFARRTGQEVRFLSGLDEFGLQRPACVGLFVAKVEQALIDFDILLAFDVGGFESVLS